MRSDLVGAVRTMVGPLRTLPRSRLHERLRTGNRLPGEGDGEGTSARFDFVPRPDPDVLLALLRHHPAWLGRAKTLVIHGPHFRIVADGIRSLAGTRPGAAWS